MVDYSYQKKAAKVVLKNTLDKKYLASVLAACPSSGKTTISHMIINDYLKKYPNARIAIFTEGQNTLKIQYLEELRNPNVDISFTFGGFKSDAQVRVGIPQSISHLKWNKIDLLIIDEAHNWFLAPTVQSIIGKLNPNHKILLTGSPTKYNLHNQHLSARKFGMYYISADDLQKQGVFSAANLDVYKVIDKKDPINTIKKAIECARKEKVDLSKIMVACPSIAYAKVVSKCLSNKGYKISLSTSEDIKSEDEIVKFKNNETNALIVVNKGILGFNDKNITALFDLKSSSNVDMSYQLFARILRKHPKSIKKNYIRISDKDHNKQVLMLHKMIALMDRNIFKEFNGKNLKMEFSF